MRKLVEKETLPVGLQIVGLQLVVVRLGGGLTICN